MTDGEMDHVVDKVIARLGVDEAIRSASESFRESVKLMEKRMLEYASAMAFDLAPLKACPFCGCRAFVFRQPDGIYRVRCSNGTCGSTLDGWSDEKSARVAWNKRVGYGW